MRRFRAVCVFVAVMAVLSVFAGGQRARTQTRTVTVAAVTPISTRDWDTAVNRMLRSSELRVRLQRDDTLIRGRSIEQLDQFYDGVRVWGGSVSRQLEGTTA